MMNLKHLSDEALLASTQKAVAQETEMTLNVLRHLREVERRRLFATLGYANLFEYATKELRYSNGSAQRRIDAMRLLKDLPEVEEKIQEGKLCLTTVARAQSFFKKEPVELEKKKEIVASLEEKSTRQVEKTLLGFSHTPLTHLHETVKVVTPELSEVKFYASDELLEQLERLKGLLAHAHPKMSTGELVAYLARLGLEKLDPLLQKGRVKRVVPAQDSPLAQKSQTQNPQAQGSKKSGSQKKKTSKNDATREPTQAAQPEKPQAQTTQAPQAAQAPSPMSQPNEAQAKSPQSKNQGSHPSQAAPKQSPPTRPRKRKKISPAKLRFVWRRDQGRCVWKSAKTGRVCGSQYLVQTDHIIPVALGGDDSVENLRCICFHHNQLEAERWFGRWSKRTKSKKAPQP